MEIIKNFKKKTKVIIFLLLLIIGSIFYFKSFLICKIEDCYSKYIQRGINYETTGNYQKAITEYKNAVKYDPKNYIPYLNIGTAYRWLKNYSKAEINYKKSISILPNNPLAYEALYELYWYEQKRNPQEISSFFDEAIKSTNGNVNIIQLYGLYLEQINDLENALIIWESLLKIDPENNLYQIKVLNLKNSLEG